MGVAMKYLVLLAAAILIASPGYAVDDETSNSGDDEAIVAEKESDKKAAVVNVEETGAERNARKDQELATAVVYYNEEVEAELDKVVCTREAVVGSRTKKRICRTVRDIEAEEAATKRLLQRRSRSSTGPAQTIGTGAN